MLGSRLLGHTIELMTTHRIQFLRAGNHGCVRNRNSKRTAAFVCLVSAAIAVTSCASAPTKKSKKSYAPAHINEETKFSSKEYGVKGSPRVTTSKKVRKGGGRYQVGKPYEIRGKWYYPKEQPNYRKVGMASWYGPNFHGRLTANGEVYDQYSLSAAHPTLPLPSYARVTNMENGAQVIVRVNDRGPFSKKRIIDLSARASELLGYQKQGLAKVKVEYVGKARMDGLDERYLTASYKPGRGQNQTPAILQGSRPGTLLAALKPPKPAIGAATAYVNEPVVTASIGFTAPVPQRRPTPVFTGSILDLSDPQLSYSTRGLEPISYLPTRAINRRIEAAFANFNLEDGDK